MEAESYNWSHFLVIGESLVSRTGTEGWTEHWVKVPKCAPLTASTTSEVKNDHAHVITQGICNKFIEVNFCLGCMASQPKCL